MQIPLCRIDMNYKNILWIFKEKKGTFLVVGVQVDSYSENILEQRGGSI